MAWHGLNWQRRWPELSTSVEGSAHKLFAGGADATFTWSLKRWGKYAIRTTAPPADTVVVKSPAYPSARPSLLSVLGLLREVISLFSTNAAPASLVGVIGFAGWAIYGIPAVAVIVSPLAHILITRLAMAPTHRAILWRGLAGPLVAAWVHEMVIALSLVCIGLPVRAWENDPSRARPPNGFK